MPIFSSFRPPLTIRAEEGRSPISHAYRHSPLKTACSARPQAGVALPMPGRFGDLKMTNHLSCALALSEESA
jgi:hypothetical protein